MRTKPSIPAKILLVAATLSFTHVGCVPSEHPRPITDRDSLLKEHVYGGLPSDGPVLVRNGYVLSYDSKRRVPSWVAYHIVPDYLKTPHRVGEHARFRPDPNLVDPVHPRDYRKSGYHRGHLAPYFAMGGDRDGDGLYAADGDPEDRLTVLEANRMTNTTPQWPGFNGSGGLWYQLETWVRKELVIGQGREVWVFAGSVFGPVLYDTIGPDDGIHVPPMFFKIVVLEHPPGHKPIVLAFLFPHQRVVHRSGSGMAIPHFLVSVDLVEAMSGLDFFQDVEGEEGIEGPDTWVNWEELQRRGPS